MNDWNNRWVFSLAIARWAFLILALFFLSFSVWNSKEILGQTIANAELIYLALALPFYILCHLIAPVFSFLTLRSTDNPVTYGQALALHVRYLPARYIPGGIWHTVGRVHGLHKLGVSPQALSVLIAMEHLVILGVALAIGGGIVGTFREDELWGRVALTASGASVAALMVLPLIRKRFLFKAHCRLAIPTYALLIAVALTFWVCISIAFVLYLSAFPDSFHADRYLEVAGAYLFSWGLGFLAVFAPQGLGVFEGVAATVLPSAQTFVALVALLAGFRVLVMFGDGVTWLVWGGWHSSQALQVPVRRDRD